MTKIFQLAKNTFLASYIKLFHCAKNIAPAY